MKLLVFVLNKHEKLDALMTEFVHVGITGATILESRGMAKVLREHDEEDIPFLGSLRGLLNPERAKSDTILAVIRDDQLKTAVETIERIAGCLETENTGIVFSVPIDYVKGFREH